MSATLTSGAAVAGELAKPFQPSAKDTALAQRLRGLARFGEAARAFVWPHFELTLRLWIAWVFVRHAGGMLPPELAWSSAVVGGFVTNSVVLAAAALLAMGLLTRLAVVPLLLQALAAAALGGGAEPLHCAALLVWFLVVGAGPFALDSVLASGAERSALPLHKGLARLYAALTRLGRPLLLLMLRLVLAAALLSAAGVVWIGGATTPLLLPWSPTLALPLAWLIACSLALGILTGVAAFGFLLAVAAAWFGGAPSIALLYGASLAGILCLQGAGRWSVDASLEARFERLVAPSTWDDERLPHVVVVGAGFGGLAVVAGLRDARCRVTLVDRRNYHLFQPLLYQVATCGLSPADIATPIRELVRDQPNVRVVLGRVTGVDVDRRQVWLSERSVRFDYLVLATGARHAYFGNDRFEAFAPGLKKIDDATDIRRRLLLAFERAEQAADPDERQALLTFVIVGGGPTGVEMAGAVAELAQHGLRGEFRQLRPENARVILVQGAPRLLPNFPEALSDATRRSLQALGVEVLCGERATDIDAEGVSLGDRRIRTRTVVWAAGVMASPAGKWIRAEQDGAGRVLVNPQLEVPGLPDVFAVGDTAQSSAWGGRPVPGIAPAAKQEGAYIARLLRARLRGASDPAPFSYTHHGNLATIGRAAAVADLGRVRLTGPVAWWFWGVVHVLFLAQPRHRVAVSLEWAWAYLTWRKSSRLITGYDG